MPNDTAKNLARCGRGLVVGPAGCGKTRLIAESVGYATGRQLVLTHTHAGVDALRTKLTAFGIPSAKYRVTTIDSLALCFTNAFPRLADWDCPYPSDNEEWSALRLAACRLFACRAPRRVLQVSYDGVFVDEYQDCCGTQHALIGSIAQALPCRIVGDPLQAIYRKLHAGDIVRWHDVEDMFPVVDVLTEPHRWRTRNSELGEWLADVRLRLERGHKIDFTNTSGIVNWIPSANYQHQIAACYRASDKEGVVAICDGPWRCATIASKTKNHFSVLESVECPDLLRAAKDIESNAGVSRLACVVAFAQECFTGMTFLADMLKRLQEARPYRPKSSDKQRLWESMQAVVESEHLAAVEVMMSAIEGLSDKHFYRRRELWRDMRRALRGHDPSSGKSLRETAWAIRDHARRNGRRVVTKRTVSTPLLIKGLEFNHALLLDAAQMETPEELYVALTRGATSLTVLSNERTVKHTIPTWIAEKPDA